MTYVLWDTETGNIVEVAHSEAEALAAAHELIVLNAPAYPSALALGRKEPGGKTIWMASGSALMERTQTHA